MNVYFLLQIKRPILNVHELTPSHKIERSIF